MYLERSKLLLTSLALLVRWGVSLWPHSGQGKPPLYGDYEAQRHWQEVTVNLEVEDWYRNTTDNDLQYWGLDYPPLTAYHSYITGRLAANINASFVSLHTSRGEESPPHKLFMRLSVLAADLLLLFPAIFMLSPGRLSTTVTLLAYPGLILIDHGHFQYNNISLGLFLAAVGFVMKNRDNVGSVLFVAALSYKQMELYHALPFFSFLLGKCLHQKTVSQKLLKLIKISLSVITAFVIIWSPFLYLGPTSVMEVVTRIFPFNRGLFEDKVANFWCALDVVYKLRQEMAIPDLAKLCLATTFTLSLPANIHLLFHPTNRNFVLGLVNTSLTFFLFSFQVHEKSILLAAVPVCLLTLVEGENVLVRQLVPWLLTITTFSMLPLLVKDGLLVPSISLSVLYLTVNNNLQSLATLVQEKAISPIPVPASAPTVASNLTRYLMILSLAGCVLITVLSQTLPPPPRYPFLWPLIICVYSAGHFTAALLAFHLLQLLGAQDRTRHSRLKEKKLK